MGVALNGKIFPRHCYDDIVIRHIEEAGNQLKPVWDWSRRLPQKGAHLQECADYYFKEVREHPTWIGWMLEEQGISGIKKINEERTDAWTRLQHDKLENGQVAYFTKKEMDAMADGEDDYTQKCEEIGMIDKMINEG